ncbi:MAG: F0F1 ATP synthase subunit epsilon [Candidatus Aminicenantes bacterium]|nr:MAG: F0F1 ATP synthase subunit epsilon [Candidatus Aminicenantes bacterium]
MSEKFPSSLRLRIIVPNKLLVDEEVKEASLPSLEGYLGILPGHRPLLTALGKGTITYQAAKGEEKFSIEGGYAEIHPDKILVFTELSENETVEA